MELKDLKNIEVEIYKGKPHFSIHHGCFNFKDHTFSRVKLISQLLSEDENYFILSLSDDRDNKLGSLTAMQVGDKIKIKVQLVDNLYNRIVVSLPSHKDEHFYGCGATYSKFDLKGENVRIWASEHQNSARMAKKTVRERIHGVNPEFIEKYNKYESGFVQPLCISSDKYFIYVDTDGYMEFDFRNLKTTKIRMFGNAEIVIGRASSYEKISGMISEIVGNVRPLPDWLYDGAILGIQRGVDEFKRKLQRIENCDMPVAAIYCRDWSGFVKSEYGYHASCNWTVDTKLYPNLRGEIVELHEKGIKFIGYINPFIVSGNNAAYKEALANDYLVKNKHGKAYLIRVQSFSVGLIDLTNPSVVTWFKDIIKNNMIDIGMDGWYADYGEYLPADCVLYDGSDPYEIHNKWPVMWAKLNREAIEETGKEKDIFFFTSSGFLNSVRYTSMMSTGSHHVDWSMDYGLPSSIPALMSMSISGAPYCHCEIGGQIDLGQMTRTDENLMRWAEIGAFSPLMRTEEGSHPIRNYQFDDNEDIRAHMTKMVKIHVQLGDYLKLLERESREKGVPMIRPLFYHYDEKKAYEESYEYMLGRDILVAPILEEDSMERIVYLPKDTWIQLFTGLVFEGGVITVRAPIGRPPVFIRAMSPYKSELMELQKI